LKIDTQRHQTERNSLAKQLREKEVESEQINADRSKIRKALMNAETEMQQMSTQLDILTNETMTMKQVEEQLQKTIEAVKIREEEINQLRTIVHAEELQLDKAQSQLKLRESDTTRLQSELANNSLQVDTLKDKVAVLQAYKDEESLRLGELRASAEESKAKLETERRNHLDALFGVSEEKEKLEETIEQLMYENKSKDSQMELLKRQTQDREAIIRDREFQIESKRQELGNSERRRTQTEEDLQQRVSELKMRTEREIELTDEVTTSKDDNKKLRAKNTELMELISNKEKRETGLINDMQVLQGDLEAKRNELNEVGKILKAKDAELNSLKDELDHKDISIKELAEELDECRSEITLSLEKLKLLEIDKVHLMRSNDEKTNIYTDLKSELRVLEKELENKSRTEAKLEQELNIQREELALMEREIVRLQEVVVKQQREVVILERELKFLGDKEAFQKQKIEIQVNHQRDEDAAKLQQSVSSLTSRLKQQLADLLKIKDTSSSLSASRFEEFVNNNVTADFGISSGSQIHPSTPNDKDFKMLLEQYEKKEQELNELKNRVR
jgi:chromosome segregation ATPase